MKPLIVANWKMNPPTLKGAKLLFNSVKKEIKNFEDVEIVICPPFIWLSTIKQFGNLTIKLGAQDVFWEESGAFTGEISPTMLKDLGCQYVIIGHSERRKYFGETDEMINKKIKAALKTKLIPILCIGETEEERKAGKTFEVLKNQLQSVLKDTKYFILNTKYLVIAYEPVWAIGTGIPCSPEDAKKALEFIKKQLPKEFPILYGGSVNANNAAPYIKEAGFNGLLVGGASLDPKEFIGIIKAVL